MTASPRIRWTEERIREIAPKFETRTDLAKGNSSAYRAAGKIPGLLDELYGNQKFKWTEALLRDLVKTCQTRNEFSDRYGGAYLACLRMCPHVLDEAYPRLIQEWKTEDAVRKEALKYSTRSELQDNNNGCYKSALCKFPYVLDEVYGPPLNLKVELEDAIKNVSGYEGRTRVWREQAASCHAIVRAGLNLDDFVSRQKECWTDEYKVRAEASKYKTRSEFYRESISAYGAAWRMGILDDLGLQDAKFGFKSSEPGYLYFAEIDLKDGTPATLFGITNNHPNFRYKQYEVAMMRSNITLMFDEASSAREAETTIKRKFRDHTIAHGLSPLRDKTGTNGEILTGLKIEDLLEAIEPYIAISVDIADWGINPNY